MLFIILIAISFVCSVDIVVTEQRKIRDVNSKPGIKLAFTKSTMDYMLKQTLPFMIKELKSTKIPDIHQDVSTPVGKISLDLTSFQLNSIGVGSPSISIVTGNEMEFTDPSISAAIHGNWHYKDHDFPYLEDSGSFDLSCTVVVSLKIGAVINPKFKSGIQVLSNYFKVGFSSFNLEMHGGASWLYNFLISEFKSTIEDTITSAVESQVPGIIVGQTQHSLDSVEFDIPVFGNVDFSFIPDEIAFNNVHQYISAGVEGKFHSTKYQYPGVPQTMPDVLSYSPMLSIFLSEFSVDSAGYVFDKESELTYILTQSDIPPKIPVKLNTEWFKTIVPNLYNYYPNDDMQITFTADTTNIPSVKFTQKDGMDISVDFDSIFQVIEANKTIVDAFTISLQLSLSGNLTVTKDKAQYEIKGLVVYKSMSMTLKDTKIGPINVSLLNDTFKFLTQYVLIPVIDQMLQHGIPLPPIPYLTLISPSISYWDQYVEVQTNFTFVLP